MKWSQNSVDVTTVPDLCRRRQVTDRRHLIFGEALPRRDERLRGHKQCGHRIADDVPLRMMARDAHQTKERFTFLDLCFNSGAAGRS